MHALKWFLTLSLFGLASPAPATEPVPSEIEAPSESEAKSRQQDAAAPESTATDPDADEAEAPVVFEAMQVVGTGDRQREIPGSAHYVGPEELERQDYDDVHRILLLVPGVTVQEEEGYGLRPNIGMRGTGSERSSKVTLLEDGVLVAPAPYAAPSAYYFPVAGRMEAFEVRKGSSSIVQGPFTNGGVLNMISTSVPSTFGGRVGVVAGEDSTLRGHARAGDMGDRFGWLLETYRFQTDGFKELDGGGDTGVELQDYLGKLRYHGGGDGGPYQMLELKLGRTDQFGDETYLGLTQADFERTPLRRYAASREDTIDTEHEQVQLRWLVQAGSGLDVTTTVYRNDFFRNWHKLQSVRGVGIGSVVDDPAGFAGELAILRGDLDSAPGDLRVRNNRRDYYGQGLQSIVGWAASDRHRLELGVRYHEDQEDRFQEEDLFAMVDGEMVFVEAGRPGSQANRVSDAEALALFAQDRIDLGRLTLTPGLRFESIDFTRTDYARDDPGRADPSVRANGVDVLIPGLGAAYRATDRLSWFGGVHKGFSPPGPGSSVDTEAEESVNYEAGLRYLAGGVELQAAAFVNDYDNLLGRDTLSSGGQGTGDLFNGGEVGVEGLEASAAHSFDAAGGTWPLRVAYTYTRAEFEDSFESDFEPWGNVTAGDELPYVPEHQVTASLGYVRPRWATHLNGSWVDDMRTAAGSGPILSGQGVEEHFLLDLAAERQLTERFRVRLQVRNLTDEVYVAARRPAGARPGLPRTVTAGFEWTF